MVRGTVKSQKVDFHNFFDEAHLVNCMLKCEKPKCSFS